MEHIGKKQMGNNGEKSMSFAQKPKPKTQEPPKIEIWSILNLHIFKKWGDDKIHTCGCNILTHHAWVWIGMGLDHD